MRCCLEEGLTEIKEPPEEETREIASNIGALFLNFGLLEHFISLAVAATFGLSELQERTFVRGLFARSKIQLLLSYSKQQWNQRYQEIMKGLADKVLKIIDYRNDIAHGVILHNKDGQRALLTFRAGHRFEGRATPLDRAYLAAVVSDMILYSRAFEFLARDIAEGKAAKTPQQK